MSKIFSENLKRVRNHYEMTQASTATACNITLKCYQSYEENRAEPPHDTLKKIVDVFHITNLYALLFNPDFLVSRDSCVFDGEVASMENKNILIKYARIQPVIRRAVDILLSTK